MDQIQAMRIFVRVVEAGTFTRAADSLGLPKGTVTKQIHDLESRLHVKLLNRTTRRVTVTPDGEPGLHYLCPSYKAFFGHIRPAMEAMCGLLRAGEAPSQITDRYAKADAKRGRNESCPCGSGRKWKKCHGTPGSYSVPSARPLRCLRYQRTSVPDGKSSTQPTSS